MPSPSNGHDRGFVIPIGGAEDKIGDQTIHKRFLWLCGDHKAHIAVIPTASRMEDTGDRYKALYTELGAGRVSVLNIEDREDCAREDYLKVLDQCTGIFMTGGNQLRLSTILGGTEIATRIRRRNAAGVHVAGTSAGAAFVPEHMIAFGDEGPRPIAGKVTLAPGLGLTNRVIVDQHFRQRNRLGRLLTALAFNPFAHGIGLDEDTAAFIGPDGRIRVEGSGALTIVDVSDLEYSGMARVDEGEPVQLIGIKMHILTQGARYDLSGRIATPG
jgi:cyanophycinase